jgi:hypothetical protein
VTDCMLCHDGAVADKAHANDKLGNNLGGYTDAECTFCHGSNGSPLMTASNHQAQDNNDTCTTAACHPSEHAELGYNAPDDCLACHKYDVAEGECAVTEAYDVVIIGAGAGGLGAGTYLSQNGYSVVLIERHHKVGGYMTNFVRGDYRFEVSTHGFDGLSPDPFVDWNVPD